MTSVMTVNESGLKGPAFILSFHAKIIFAISTTVMDVILHVQQVKFLTVIKTVLLLAGLLTAFVT
jgi:hypothetical protein